VHSSTMQKGMVIVVNPGLILVDTKVCHCDLPSSGR
jgi:hypothetical protein